MKCPKCRYLSFEPELRCKHCGFDFSMAEHVPRHRFDELEQQDPDLPMVDLQLRSLELEVETDFEPDERPAPALRRQAVATAVAVAERVAPARVAMPPVARPLPTPPADLPLFNKRPAISEDATMHVPAAPRPLAVRRGTPEAPRPVAPAAPVVRAMPINRADTSQAARMTSPMALPPAVSGEVDAPARLKAAGLDLAVLAGLNIAVVLLTLRQCDLTIAQIARVPMVPLIGFLAAITVGYLLSFNVVSGQTIGKMVFGLRVVGAERGDDLPPTSRQMSYRALLTVPSILLLGLGFLPGLVGEGRAVHDRLTHTRVVRE